MTEIKTRQEKQIAIMESAISRSNSKTTLVLFSREARRWKKKGLKVSFVSPHPSVRGLGYYEVIVTQIPSPLNSWLKN